MEVFFVYMLVALCCSSLCQGALLAPPPVNSTSAADLRLGFYSQTCPQAEDIVRAQVQKRFLLDKTITPALLRMLFHDSFVRGADASILLDSKPGHEAEKEALPNLTIRGFDLIGEVKEVLESACPGVVSCADIIVLAVRDSVALAGGPKYGVPTGRLDGKISIKEEALNLPSPAFPVEQSQESFRQKGLDLGDMVALLGAHTVGVALCGLFNDRLFNFHGTGAADPTMNPQLVTRLSTVCPNPFFTESNADPPIDLDQSTVAVFDSAYYSQILAGNGILQIDQEITADPSTLGFVQSFTSTAAFFPAFVRSIIKMGNIEVKTGANPLGEVRRQCNVSNSGAIVRTPAKPAPGGSVSKTPPIRLPPATKPAPTAPVSKQPPVTRPAPAAPVTKPAPVGHGSRTPPITKPAPAVPVAGHGSKNPPVIKPSPAGHGNKPPQAPIPKPAPGGHVAKPPTTPVTKPAPIITKPAPPGHVSKPGPPAGHTSRGGAPVTPVPKPAPPGHISKPPMRKPTPAAHVKRGPPTAPPRSRPVSKPLPPIGRGLPTTPVGARAPPRQASKQPAPSGHVSKQLPHTPIAKPAPQEHVSNKPPVADPAPGAHGSSPPVGPPHQSSTPSNQQVAAGHVSR